MADNKVSNVSRSQVIRDHLEAHPEAANKDVVAALAARGVETSPGLVANVRSRMQSKSKAKKAGKPRRKRPAGGVNKSQAVRDFMAEHPTAIPSEIISGLGQQGVTVTHGLISMVKRNAAHKKAAPARRGRPPGRRPGRPAGASASAGARSSLSVADLVAAKKLTERLGTADKVRQALDALEQLR